VYGPILPGRQLTLLSTYFEWTAQLTASKKVQKHSESGEGIGGGAPKTSLQLPPKGPEHTPPGK
jgi:hypothetical protein